ncbi:HD domain-containing protein, partial [Streptomyces decoyicus]
MPDEAQPLSPGLRPAGSDAARPDEPKLSDAASSDAPRPERQGASDGTATPRPAAGGSAAPQAPAERPRTAPKPGPAASSPQPASPSRAAKPPAKADQPPAPKPPTPAPAGRSGSPNRVRARLARLGVQRSSPYNPVLEPLLRAVRGNDPKIETGTLRQIERAYQVAERWHRGQKRKSGDPYITHPLAVTTILAELGMDPATLMAGLLHDTVEDTEYGLDTLRGDFGDQVALLVDGVTKLDRVKFGEAAQAETVRKMVVAMAKDPRVLVIKLADRLHNMRTMRYLERQKQQKTPRETLKSDAP